MAPTGVTSYDTLLPHETLFTQNNVKTAQFAMDSDIESFFLDIYTTTTLHLNTGQFAIYTIAQGSQNIAYRDRILNPGDMILLHHTPSTTCLFNRPTYSDYNCYTSQCGDNNPFTRYFIVNLKYNSISTKQSPTHHSRCTDPASSVSLQLQFTLKWTHSMFLHNPHQYFYEHPLHNVHGIRGYQTQSVDYCDTLALHDTHFIQTNEDCHSSQYNTDGLSFQELFRSAANSKYRDDLIVNATNAHTIYPFNIYIVQHLDVVNTDTTDASQSRSRQLYQHQTPLILPHTGTTDHLTSNQAPNSSAQPQIPSNFFHSKNLIIPTKSLPNSDNITPQIKPHDYMTKSLNFSQKTTDNNITAQTLSPNSGTTTLLASIPQLYNQNELLAMQMPQKPKRVVTNRRTIVSSMPDTITSTPQDTTPAPSINSQLNLQPDIMAHIPATDLSNSDTKSPISNQKPHLTLGDINYGTPFIPCNLLYNMNLPTDHLIPRDLIFSAPADLPKVLAISYNLHYYRMVQLSEQFQQKQSKFDDVKSIDDAEASISANIPAKTEKIQRKVQNKRGDKKSNDKSEIPQSFFPQPAHTVVVCPFIPQFSNHSLVHLSTSTNNLNSHHTYDAQDPLKPSQNRNNSQLLSDFADNNGDYSDVVFSQHPTQSSPPNYSKNSTNLTHHSLQLRHYIVPQSPKSTISRSRSLSSSNLFPSLTQQSTVVARTDRVDDASAFLTTENDQPPIITPNKLHTYHNNQNTKGNENNVQNTHVSALNSTIFKFNLVQQALTRFCLQDYYISQDTDSKWVPSPSPLPHLPSDQQLLMVKDRKAFNSVVYKKPSFNYVLFSNIDFCDAQMKKACPNDQLDITRMESDHTTVYTPLSKNNNKSRRPMHVCNTESSTNPPQQSLQASRQQFSFSTLTSNVNQVTMDLFPLNTFYDKQYFSNYKTHHYWGNNALHYKVCYETSNINHNHMVSNCSPSQKPQIGPALLFSNFFSNTTNLITTGESFENNVSFPVFKYFSSDYSPHYPIRISNDNLVNHMNSCDNCSQHYNGLAFTATSDFFNNFNSNNQYNNDKSTPLSTLNISQHKRPTNKSINQTQTTDNISTATPQSPSAITKTACPILQLVYLQHHILTSTNLTNSKLIDQFQSLSIAPFLSDDKSSKPFSKSKDGDNKRLVMSHSIYSKLKSSLKQTTNDVVLLYYLKMFRYLPTSPLTYRQLSPLLCQNNDEFDSFLRKTDGQEDLGGKSSTFSQNTNEVNDDFDPNDDHIDTINAPKFPNTANKTQDEKGNIFVEKFFHFNSLYVKSEHIDTINHQPHYCNIVQLSYSGITKTETISPFTTMIAQLQSYLLHVIQSLTYSSTTQSSVPTKPHIISLIIPLYPDKFFFEWYTHFCANFLPTYIYIHIIIVDFRAVPFRTPYTLSPSPKPHITDPSPLDPQKMRRVMNKGLDNKTLYIMAAPTIYEAYTYYTIPSYHYHGLFDLEKVNSPTINKCHPSGATINYFSLKSYPLLLDLTNLYTQSAPSTINPAQPSGFRIYKYNMYIPSPPTRVNEHNISTPMQYHPNINQDLVPSAFFTPFIIQSPSSFLTYKSIAPIVSHAVNDGTSKNDMAWASSTFGSVQQPKSRNTSANPIFQGAKDSSTKSIVTLMDAVPNLSHELQMSDISSIKRYLSSYQYILLSVNDPFYLGNNTNTLNKTSATSIACLQNILYYPLQQALNKSYNIKLLQYQHEYCSITPRFNNNDTSQKLESFHFSLNHSYFNDFSLNVVLSTQLSFLLFYNIITLHSSVYNYSSIIKPIICDEINASSGPTVLIKNNLSYNMQLPLFIPFSIKQTPIYGLLIPFCEESASLSSASNPHSPNDPDNKVNISFLLLCNHNCKTFLVNMVTYYENMRHMMHINPHNNSDPYDYLSVNVNDIFFPPQSSNNQGINDHYDNINEQLPNSTNQQYEQPTIPFRHHLEIISLLLYFYIQLSMLSPVIPLCTYCPAPPTIYTHHSTYKSPPSSQTKLTHSRDDGPQFPVMPYNTQKDFFYNEIQHSTSNFWYFALFHIFFPSTPSKEYLSNALLSVIWKHLTIINIFYLTIHTKPTRAYQQIHLPYYEIAFLGDKPPNYYIFYHLERQLIKLWQSYQFSTIYHIQQIPINFKILLQLIMNEFCINYYATNKVFNNIFKQIKYNFFSHNQLISNLPILLNDTSINNTNSRPSKYTYDATIPLIQQIPSYYYSIPSQSSLNSDSPGNNTATSSPPSIDFTMSTSEYSTTTQTQQHRPFQDDEFIALSSFLSKLATFLLNFSYYDLTEQCPEHMLAMPKESSLRTNINFVISAPNVETKAVQSTSNINKEIRGDNKKDPLIEDNNILIPTLPNRRSENDDPIKPPSMLPKNNSNHYSQLNTADSPDIQENKKNKDNKNNNNDQHDINYTINPYDQFYTENTAVNIKPIAHNPTIERNKRYIYETLVNSLNLSFSLSTSQYTSILPTFFLQPDDDSDDEILTTNPLHNHHFENGGDGPIVDSSELAVISSTPDTNTFTNNMMEGYDDHEPLSRRLRARDQIDHGYGYMSTHHHTTLSLPLNHVQRITLGQYYSDIIVKGMKTKGLTEPKYPKVQIRIAQRLATLHRSKLVSRFELQYNILSDWAMTISHYSNRIIPFFAACLCPRSRQHFVSTFKHKQKIKLKTTLDKWKQSLIKKKLKFLAYQRKFTRKMLKQNNQYYSKETKPVNQSDNNTNTNKNNLNDYQSRDPTPLQQNNTRLNSPHSTLISQQSTTTSNTNCNTNSTLATSLSSNANTSDLFDEMFDEDLLPFLVSPRKLLPKNPSINSCSTTDMFSRTNNVAGRHGITQDKNADQIHHLTHSEGSSFANPLDVFEHDQKDVGSSLRGIINSPASHTPGDHIISKKIELHNDDKHAMRDFIDPTFFDNGLFSSNIHNINNIRHSANNDTVSFLSRPSLPEISSSSSTSLLLSVQSSQEPMTSFNANTNMSTPAMTSYNSTSSSPAPYYNNFVDFDFEEIGCPDSSYVSHYNYSNIDKYFLFVSQYHRYYYNFNNASDINNEYSIFHGDISHIFVNSHNPSNTANFGKVSTACEENLDNYTYFYRFNKIPGNSPNNVHNLHDFSIERIDFNNFPIHDNSSHSIPQSMASTSSTVSVSSHTQSDKLHQTPNIIKSSKQYCKQVEEEINSSIELHQYPSYTPSPSLSHHPSSAIIGHNNSFVAQLLYNEPIHMAYKRMQSYYTTHYNYSNFQTNVQYTTLKLNSDIQRHFALVYDPYHITSHPNGIISPTPIPSTLYPALLSPQQYEYYTKQQQQYSQDPFNPLLSATTSETSSSKSGKSKSEGADMIDGQIFAPSMLSPIFHPHLPTTSVWSIACATIVYFILALLLLLQILSIFLPPTLSIFLSLLFLILFSPYFLLKQDFMLLFMNTRDNNHKTTISPDSSKNQGEITENDLYFPTIRHYLAGVTSTNDEKNGNAMTPAPLITPSTVTSTSPATPTSTSQQRQQQQRNLPIVIIMIILSAIISLLLGDSLEQPPDEEMRSDIERITDNLFQEYYYKQLQQIPMYNKYIQSVGDFKRVLDEIKESSKKMLVKFEDGNVDDFFLIKNIKRMVHQHIDQRFSLLNAHMNEHHLSNKNSNNQQNLHVKINEDIELLKQINKTTRDDE